MIRTKMHRNYDHKKIKFYQLYSKCSMDFVFFKQAIRNKEIDMKTGAEILGVSYGTLYGRYRETIGYLKHAWNNAGRTSKPSSYSYR